MQKQKIFEIICNECKEKQISIVSIDNISLVNNEFINTQTSSKIELDDISFTQLAYILLELNTKISLINACNIAAKLQSNDINAHKALLQKTFDAIENSDLFTQINKYFMFLLLMETMQKLNALSE